MNAEIISIGTEILRGEITDTNASWLAARLPALGITLTWVTQVGDHPERLAEAFRRALGRSDIILTTGGLGPTADDLTRETIADVLGEQLRVDSGLEAHLRGFFDKMGWEMPPHNIKQAMLVPSAQSIPNPRGTAPGWWVERAERVMVAMPGPPREMNVMWTQQVVPRLMQRCGGLVIEVRTLKVSGVSEAGLDEMVGRALPDPPVEIGIYAKSDGMHVRLVAREADRRAAEEKIRAAEAALRGAIDQYIWGIDDDSLHGVVEKLLTDHHDSIATMESYTGGLLAALCGEMPASDRIYRGGFVVNSAAARARFGQTGPSADDAHSDCEQMALSMAREAARVLEASVGIGIADSAPAGRNQSAAAIAIVGHGQHRVRQLAWPTSRREVRQWFAVAALLDLRRFLLDS